MTTAREDAWSSKWISEKAITHEKVASAIPTAPNQVTITLTTGKNVIIATMSSSSVNTQDLQSLLSSAAIEFVVNVQKESYIGKDALDYSERCHVGLGGLGDLFTAINDDDFRNYVSKEARFILRGLRQHTEVSNVVRLDNRRYQVMRYTYPTITILALNEYDLTADAVRSGVDKYGECDIILTSNPNCRPSSESLAAAKSMGIIVLKWGYLMGALNSEIK